MTGTATDSSWDPNLTDAMRRSGQRGEEEFVLDTLLDDLTAT